MRLLMVPIFMALLVCCLAMERFNVKQSTTFNTARQPDPTICYTEDQDEGRCVKHSMCDMEPPKIDPSDDFIYRSQDTPYQCEFLKMCCPHDKVRSLPVVPVMAPAPGCGYSYPGGVFREMTGTYADFGEFPWMVALLKKNYGGGLWLDENYVGGGTLINPSVVMTVAHRVDTFQHHELKCRAGEWNTRNENEILNHQERDVSRILIHPEFSRKKAHNDIALLIMETAFVITPHVNVACLGRSLPPPETVCYSMGWGKDFPASNFNAHVLKKITLPLIAPGHCQNQLRNTRLGRGYELHESLTCAGGMPNVDTCIGDGGSSLVCHIGEPGNLRYKVIGMVAYGLECGTDNVPGVYVKIPHVRAWVDKQIEELEVGK
ncbi:phenoloxidase-activating factor 2-like isoform X2 [Pararge aegeria]|uniref:phenoloxidase-activating factor 2-like isoform X2 n=1 Tax=Pararge aegeria TaxID=116150 RepID=UPI0019D04888|nr:phenoloxidase-activating factor 2-like isoform X2 [Pararge aegeria]